MISDLTPAQIEEGKQNALIALGGILSGQQAADLASAFLEGRFDTAFIAGAFALLIDALTEHGTDPAEWIARKQDEALGGQAQDTGP